MSQLKHLTPQQKEKATPLMYDADEMEAANEKKLANLAERCRLTVERSKAELLVSDTIYPGVRIIFPGVEAVITTAFQGPARIVPRKVGNVTEIVLEEQGDAVCPLASVNVADHFTPFTERIRGGQKAA